MVKDFYKGYHDHIFDKRYNSPYWIRRYAHRKIYESILRYVHPGQKVLDVGCGEGVLSLLMAQKGAIVTGVDLSLPNVKAARCKADEAKLPIVFGVADAENLPFGDDSFDVVVSSHILEHLPNLVQGLRELYRVTRRMALIAMPTCLNPAAWALLGGDSYFKFSKRSLFAIPLGLIKTLAAAIQGKEGPDEGYAGKRELPHVWRFPWIMRRQIESVGFRIARFEAGPLIIPYLAEYVSIARCVQVALDHLREYPLIRYFGYGSLALCYKYEKEHQ
jgi:SAM-dependent methyltransferase